MQPKPTGYIDIVAAGMSGRGVEFASEYCGYNFTSGSGRTGPLAFVEANNRLVEAELNTGRDVGALEPFMIISGETDEAAWAKWNLYCEGIGSEATRWIQNKSRTAADESLITRGVVSK